MQALSSLSAVLAQPSWLPQALILSRASAFPVTGPERSGWALGPHWPNPAGPPHAPSSLAGCLPTRGWEAAWPGLPCCGRLPWRPRNQLESGGCAAFPLGPCSRGSALQGLSAPASEGGGATAQWGLFLCQPQGGSSVLLRAQYFLPDK